MNRITKKCDWVCLRLILAGLCAVLPLSGVRAQDTLAPKSLFEQDANNADLLDILGHFPIGEILHPIKKLDLGKGAGTKFKVVTSTGTYFLKMLNPAHADPVMEARCEVSPVNVLVQQNERVIPMLQNKDQNVEEEEDRYFVRANNGNIYFLQPWVDGDALPKASTVGDRPYVTPEQAHELTIALARHQKAWAQSPPKFYRTARPLKDLQPLLQRLRELKKRLEDKRTHSPDYAYTPAETFFLQNADFLMEQIQSSMAHLPPEAYQRLPRGMIHGDLHPSNAIFRGNDLIAVTDWEHMRFDVRTLDIFCGHFQELTESGSYNTAELQRVVKDYQQFISLTPEELAALPELARLNSLYNVLHLVRPEDMHERNLYAEEIQKVYPLEQAIWLLDHHPSLAKFFNRQLSILKAVDTAQKNGAFDRLLEPKSQDRQGMHEIGLIPTLEQAHAYQLFKMEKHWDDYRFVYSIPLDIEENVISADGTAISAEPWDWEWRYATRFFSDPVIAQWMTQVGAGLRDKKLLVLTADHGGFAAKAAQEGAHVTVLECGPGHHALLQKAFQKLGVQDIHFAGLPKNFTDALQTHYDFVYINLDFVPMTTLDQTQLLKEIFNHIAADTIVFVDTILKRNSNKLKFSYPSAAMAWRAIVCQGVSESMRGEMYAEGRHAAQGQILEQMSLSAILSRNHGMSLKPAAPLFPEPIARDFEHSWSWAQETHQTERQTLMQSSRKYFELTHHGKDVQGNPATTVFKDFHAPNSCKANLAELAQYQSPYLLDFYFDFLHAITDRADQTDKGQDKADARNLLQECGDDLIAQLLVHLKAYPPFIEQVLPLVLTLAEHPYVPTKGTKAAKAFLKEIGTRHKDLLHAILKSPRRLSDNAPAFMTALQILEDMADPDDIALLVSIAHDPLGPQEGLSPQGIPLQLADGRSITVPEEETVRDDARDLAWDALIAIAKKLPGKSPQREAIGKELAEIVRQTIAGCQHTPHWNARLGPMVNNLGLLGDSQGIAVIQEALAHEMALSKTATKEQHIRASVLPGTNAPWAVARIAKKMPDGELKSQALAWLRSLLEDPLYKPAPAVRLKAMEELGYLQDAVSRPLLEECMLDPHQDFDSRFTAYVALSHIGCPFSIAPMLTFLTGHYDYLLDRPDLEGYLMDGLGLIRPYVGELQQANVLMTLPDQVAQRMQASTPSVQGHAAAWIRNFVFGAQTSDRFERVAILFELQNHAEKMGADLMLQRAPAIGAALKENAYWPIVAPAFPILFGLREDKTPVMDAMAFEEFLERLKSLQKKNASFGLKAMHTAITDCGINNHLIRQVFANLLVQPNLKETVFRMHHDLSQELLTHNVSLKRLFNLNDPAKVENTLRAMLPYLSNSDKENLGATLRKQTGCELQDFLDPQKELVGIYADELVDACAHHAYDKETQGLFPGIIGAWKEFDYAKADGISFRIVPRDRSFMKWGKYTGDCSAPGQPAFWGRAGQLLHPAWFQMAVYYQGKLVDLLDLGLFQFSLVGEIVVDIDAHEATLRSSSDAGAAANQQILEHREEILDAAMARVVQWAKEAGLHGVLATGWSNRPDVEAYYKKKFPRLEFPVLLSLYGGRPLLDSLANDTLAVGQRDLTLFYLQSTTRAGHSEEVWKALDVLEGHVRRVLKKQGYYALHLALNAGNFAQAGRLIRETHEYKNLRDDIGPPLIVLQNHGLVVQDALRILFGTSNLHALAKPYVIAQTRKAIDSSLSWIGEDILWADEEIRKIRDKRSHQARFEIFLNDVLVPNLGPLLGGKNKKLQETVCRIANHAWPDLGDLLAQHFKIKDPQAALQAMSEDFMPMGYYFNVLWKVQSAPFVNIARITHIVLLPSKGGTLSMLKLRHVEALHINPLPHLAHIPLIKHVHGINEQEVRQSLIDTAIERAQINRYYDRKDLSPSSRSLLLELSRLAAKKDPIRYLKNCLEKVVSQQRKGIPAQDKSDEPLHQVAGMFLEHFLPEEHHAVNAEGLKAGLAQLAVFEKDPERYTPPLRDFTCKAYEALAGEPFDPDYYKGSLQLIRFSPEALREYILKPTQDAADLLEQSA